MLKWNRWLALTLLLMLVSGVGYARDDGGVWFDTPKTYIQTLEDALDARYGGRDAWPEGFDVLLGIAKLYGGLDASYTPPEPDAIGKFLFVFKETLEFRDGFMRSWPYEAHALYAAALIYSGNPDLSNHWALPGENDLTEAEAIAIARKAIQEQYTLSDQEIDELGIYTQFIADDMPYGTPYWYVTIGINEIGAERYYACVTSPEGEIMIATRNDGNG